MINMEVNNTLITNPAPPYQGSEEVFKKKLTKQNYEKTKNKKKIGETR